MVYPLLLLVLICFLSVGLVSADLISSGTYEVPRFRISDLRSGRRASDLKHVLRTTGLLALTLDDDEKAGHELTTHRTTAFDGLCKCALPRQSSNNGAPLLSVRGADSATLADGVTARTTLATATVGYTPIPLPAEELSQACSSADGSLVDALEGLRDTLADATAAFIDALDGIVSSPTHHQAPTPLLKTATGASYTSVRDVVGASKNLEHMHVYSRDDSIDDTDEIMDGANSGDALQLHTDAGLFLSFIPARSCSGFENTPDHSFKVLDTHDGQLKVAVFPQDVPSVAIMLGIGAEQWLNIDQEQNFNLKATRHKVSMKNGDRRAWYGMMHLVPDTAIVHVAPQRTFADMRQSVANRRSVASRRFGDDAQREEVEIAIGCGSYIEDNLHQDASENEGVEPIRPYRRRLQHVVDGSVCNNVTNFYCWMTCQEIPDYENAAIRLEEGQSLYCLDPAVLAGSSDRVNDAVMSCVDYRGVVGAAENPGCVGSWQTTTRGIPSQIVSVVQESYLDDQQYCYGSTSMYMHGFQWQGTTCVAYLFPSWVLNTPGKFAAAAVGTVFFGILLEASIYLRRIVTSYISAKADPGEGRTAKAGNWKYILVSAGTYMVQLTLGYLIMLVVMTFSAPLFIAVIVGLGSGHILFSILRSRQEKKPCPCNSSPKQGTHSTPQASASSSIMGGNSLRQVGLLPLPEGSTPCCMNNIPDDGLLQNSALPAPIDDDEENICGCKVDGEDEEKLFTNEFSKSEATASCCGSAIGNV